MFAQQPYLFAGLLLLAPLACIAAAVATRGRERRAWALVGVGAGLMAAADIYAVSHGGLAGPAILPGSPVVSVVWLSSFAPYAVATEMFLEPPWAPIWSRSRSVADVFFTIAIASIAGFALSVYPEYGHSPDASLDAVLVYFGAMSCALGIALFALVRRTRFRLWHVLLVAAGALTCAGAAYGLVSLARGYADMNLPRLPYLPWLLGFALIAAAAGVRAWSARTVQREYVIYVNEMSYRSTLIATAVFFLALPFFVNQIMSWTGDPVGYYSYSGLIGVACLLAVLRNVFVAVENAQLRQHSTSDSLTGLVNHRHFHERLETELMRAQREGVPLSVALFDVDDFDRVNNIYGHQAGDRRLRSIAESIDLSSRTFDVACRTGGDEFALIMPDADPIAAYRVCLRIAERLAEEDGVCPEPSTLSAGIATYPEHAEERDEIVHRADGALYWAKYHEGGSVVIYDPDSVRALGPEQRIALLEEESYLNMVQMLAVAADARDPYTQRHSRDVADFAILLAEDLGFDEERIALLKTAALLHDVGKIGIPDSVLKKPGPLSEEEYGLVQGHPELAVHILGSIPRQEILPWILSHHEHWDGGGYPQGLAGAAAPLEARILALCDAYDAMTTDRPYRGSMSHAEACEEIVACAGTQFDPDLAQRFVDLFSEHSSAIGMGAAAPSGVPIARETQ